MRRSRTGCPIMNTRALVTGLAVVIAAIGIGMTLYQRAVWRSVAAEVAALREITTERDRLRAEVLQLQERLRAEKAQRDRPPDEVSGRAPHASGTAADRPSLPPGAAAAPKNPPRS